MWMIFLHLYGSVVMTGFKARTFVREDVTAHEGGVSTPGENCTEMALENCTLEG
jgi:hypothetical protein